MKSDVCVFKADERCKSGNVALGSFLPDLRFRCGGPEVSYDAGPVCALTFR